MKRLASPVLLLGLLMCFASAYGGEFDIAETPSWVIRHDIHTPAKMPEAQISDGVYYLLLDRQVNIGRQQTCRFSRVVKKVISPQGVENASQLYITFDPAYERLTFHCIRIHRGQEAIDQLYPERIDVIQRESDLERRLYNGEKTASIILEDTRPGDLIEYAYSVSGRNPVFEDRYMDEVDTGWSVPLGALYYRWIFTNGRPVFNKLYDCRCTLETRSIENGIEYRYTDQHIDAILADEDLPAWYMPYPRIQITQFPDWAAVANWGAALYHLPQRIPQALRSRIEELKQAGTTAEKIARALCLVQNEIRYLGMEIGAGSYQPTPPEITYGRKFGDCKDKSILLCTLLDKVGVRAKPALVNTYLQGRVDGLLPSAQVFNHVIVRVQDNEQIYWIDPTADCQTVPLDRQYQALFGRALVLDKGTRALADTGQHELSEPAKEIHEEFDLTAGVNRPAVFTVKTICRGREADRLRNGIKSSGLQQTAKSFLNFYAADYPSVAERQPISVEDDPAANAMVITEFYRIPEFWELSEDGNTSVAEVVAREFRSLFQKPGTTVRSMPIGITHPQYITQRTTIKLPETWRVTPDQGRVENDAMQFTYAADYADKVMTLSYDYRSKQDFIDAAHSAGYIADLNHIKDQIGYSLSWSVNDRQTSWFMIGASLAGLFLAVGLGIAAWRYDPPAPPILQPHAGDAALKGLGGWLVLVMLGLFAKPLLLIKWITDQLPAFKLSYWDQIEEALRPGLGSGFKVLVGCEVAMNIILLVLMTVLLLHFFKKRTAFPNLFITITLGSVVIALADTVLGASMLKQANTADPMEVNQLIRAVISSVVWSMYMVKSTRVRQTFRSRRQPKPHADPTGILAPAESEAPSSVSI